MKKVLLLLIIFLGINKGFCQSQKNDLNLTLSALPLLGSSEGFNTGINGFAIKSAFGYYISDKTAIHLNFTYATMDNIKIDNYASYYQSFAIVPTIRNNFFNKNKWQIFAEFGMGIGSIKYNPSYGNPKLAFYDDASGGISIINLGIGGNYYFNKNFGIEFILPYINSHNITSEYYSKIYSGIAPTLGLTYKLN